jgi:hypothetical protein
MNADRDWCALDSINQGTDINVSATGPQLDTDVRKPTPASAKNTSERIPRRLQEWHFIAHRYWARGLRWAHPPSRLARNLIAVGLSQRDANLIAANIDLEPAPPEF